MCCQKGRHWITYNGEVYNYIELREELSAYGHQFETLTDTEVVLKAYIQWGVKCLEKFNGMFAFIVYDHHEKTIFAARDRFGIKPLYFWKPEDQTIAFASEIKQFTSFKEWRASLHHQAAYDFLNWCLTDHSKHTLFKGVSQLNAGHYIFATQDNLCTKPINFTCWYHFKKNPIRCSFQEACSHFHDLFLDAVKIRLRADVPIGSCLSGGLDSSSIVSAIASLYKKQKTTGLQNTFSACSHLLKYDEKNYIDKVVSKYQLNAHYTYPQWENLKKHLLNIVWQQDEPFLSSSIFAQWSVFELTDKQKVRVVLDGQGADEQLAGYHSFFGYRFYELFLLRNFSTLFKELKEVNKSHPHLSSLQLLFNRLLPSKFKQPLLKLLNKPHETPNWIDFSILEATPQIPLLFEKQNDITSHSHTLLKTNLPMLLRYEDRNSMHHSVEARTPFLDYRLVEYCLNLQSEHKIEGAWTKKVLREAMSPYLPSNIKTRMDKKAFITPEEAWLKQEPDYFRELFKESLELSEGIIHTKALNTFESMIQEKVPFSFLPWRVICFGQWLKCYQVDIK